MGNWPEKQCHKSIQSKEINPPAHAKGGLQWLQYHHDI
jgi:hypothetical protein